jgi:hypothetical protein
MVMNAKEWNRQFILGIPKGKKTATEMHMKSELSKYKARLLKKFNPNKCYAGLIRVKDVIEIVKHSR